MPEITHLPLRHIIHTPLKDISNQHLSKCLNQERFKELHNNRHHSNNRPKTLQVVYLNDLVGRNKGVD